MRTKTLVICMVLVLFFAGCCFSPASRQATEMAAITIGSLNEDCQAGDPNACRKGLNAAAEIMDTLVEAMYGRAGNAD